MKNKTTSLVLTMLMSALALTLILTLTSSVANAILPTIKKSQIPNQTLPPMPTDVKPAPKFTEVLDINTGSNVYLQGDTQKYDSIGTLHINALLVNHGNTDADLVIQTPVTATVLDAQNNTLAQETSIPVSTGSGNAYVLHPHQSVEVQYLIDDITDLSKIHTIIYHNLNQQQGQPTKRHPLYGQIKAFEGQLVIQ